MKIVHIAECFAGGVYDFISELTNGLRQHEHIIVYGKRENTPISFSSDFSPDVRFIPWNAGREIRIEEDAVAFIGLLRILSSIERYDVVHLHSSKAGFLGRIAAKILGKSDKVIYTPHGVSFLRRDVSSLKQKFYVALERLGNIAGGRVVACSKSEAEAFHKNNIPAAYVYNGVNIKPYVYPKQHKNNSKIIIGTVGRITEQKNPALFNKIANAFSNNQNVEFRWVGDGEQKAALTSPNICVTGWQAATDVVKELSRMDIYLSTSLWEGLPLAAIQAMVSGLPLVVSQCVGNIDIVKPNQNGYVYSKAEEAKYYLLRLIQDAALRKKLGIESRKFAEQCFSLEDMISGYVREYESIVEGK